MSQNSDILNALLSGRKLTQLDALKQFGCMRLASRISDLREQGHAIKTTIIKTNNKRFAEYELLKNQTTCTN